MKELPINFIGIRELTRTINNNPDWNYFPKEHKSNSGENIWKISTISQLRALAQPLTWCSKRNGGKKWFGGVETKKSRTRKHDDDTRTRKRREKAEREKADEREGSRRRGRSKQNTILLLRV